MDWTPGREEAIAQLQVRVREHGSFVERALVREIKVASELFPAAHAAWFEVLQLVENWERGASDVSALEAVRHINRSASCWKSQASNGAGGGVRPRDPTPTP